MTGLSERVTLCQGGMGSIFQDGRGSLCQGLQVSLCQRDE